MTDPRTAALRASVYAFFYLFTWTLVGGLLYGIGGYFFGPTMSSFVAGWTANFLALRIFEPLPFVTIGLWANGAAVRNLLFGFGGGVGTASLVLGVPILTGASTFNCAGGMDWSTFLFVAALLFLGSAGEELAFRGYGFQVLIRAFGPFTTILPVGVAFAALHAPNPNSTWIGLANTAGFGILFGYAFWRSRDLWLPIGLHFGWNFTLPLAGANVSGFTMKVTGCTLVWNAGPVWSGGDYGPEGSVLTSAALAALFLYLWKVPIRMQHAPLLTPPEEV